MDKICDLSISIYDIIKLYTYNILGKHIFFYIYMYIFEKSVNTTDKMDFKLFFINNEKNLKMFNFF